MQKTECLIEKEGMPLESVYMDAGFENENAFRMAYKKYKA